MQPNQFFKDRYYPVNHQRRRVYMAPQTDADTCRQAGCVPMLGADIAKSLGRFQRLGYEFETPDTDTNRHGGARPGSGRKRTGNRLKLIRLEVEIKRHLDLFVKAEKKRRKGVTKAALLSQWILEETEWDEVIEESRQYISDGPTVAVSVDAHARLSEISNSVPEDVPLSALLAAQVIRCLKLRGVTVS